jgi:protein-S-isoprenylcysteine O-methyltransferase Ste14
MKLLTDWGFNPKSWQGKRGEYWFMIQVVLILGFAVLPIYRLPELNPSPPSLYGVWIAAAGMGIVSLIVLLRGLLDLGQNLTPLPHPKQDGQLVQTGMYSAIRHPLYSGLILAAVSWAVFQCSISHLVAAIVLALFLNAKASREEVWLIQMYPDYLDYRQRVKKLIPWLY